MNLKEMGRCIKRCREKMDISHVELAQKTGIAVEALLSYESGMQRPTYRDLKKISKEINVPMVMLVHGGGVVRRRYVDESGKPVCETREY